MAASLDPDDTIRRLIEWAEQRPAIRAMLLTSSRANPSAPVDILSDYDVVLVVQDVHPFFTDRTWLQDFGEVLVVYWDPIHPKPGYGLDQVSNVIQYADGLKIDFNVWPVGLLQQIVQSPALPDDLDVGYAVLLDKDHLTAGLKAPSYTVYLPQRPGEATYQKAIEDFFSDAPYVAKCLWRDELLPAKWCLDYDMKHISLRLMLEWRVGLDHSWSVPTGALGRGLKRQLPPHIWSQLESTYVGAGIEDNWEALFRTMALFRQVAVGVAEQLGYAYPYELDERVTAYVQHVRGLDHRAGAIGR